MLGGSRIMVEMYLKKKRESLREEEWREEAE